MTKLLRLLTCALTAVLLLGACGTDEPTIGTAEDTDVTDSEAATDATAAPGGSTSTADDGAEAGIVLTAELTGAAEKPDPGDADGSGKASVTIETSTNELCFELSVAKIAEATMAHIHRGDAETAGPVVVELTAPTGGSSSGCSAVQAELANEIAESPESFYVNVHNAEFPKGAVRGQLAAS